jgi:hypothetical protein
VKGDTVHFSKTNRALVSNKNGSMWGFSLPVLDSCLEESFTKIKLRITRPASRLARTAGRISHAQLGTIGVRSDAKNWSKAAEERRAESGTRIWAYRSISARAASGSAATTAFTRWISRSRACSKAEGSSEKNRGSSRAVCPMVGRPTRVGTSSKVSGIERTDVLLPSCWRSSANSCSSARVVIHVRNWR